MSKLVRDLIVDTTETTVSEAVSMGGHNAVMFEVWLKSLSGTLPGWAAGPPVEGLVVTVEGSNDKLNWKVAHSGARDRLTKHRRVSCRSCTSHKHT